MKPSIFIFFFFYSIFSYSQLSVAEIFSSDMVLQRNKPIHIWGKARPKDLITLTFFNQKKSTYARSDSTWNIYLQKAKSNSTPQELIVESNNNKIVLKNILMGDVWLCLGQSNMEWPMNKEIHFTEEKPFAYNTSLRFYNPSYAGKNVYGTEFNDSIIVNLNNAFYSATNWQKSDSNSFKSMTAVGYYFGKDIVEQTKVPIGLINLSIGGAPLETFMDKDILKQSSQFSNKIHGDWLLNKNLPNWVKQRGYQNVGNTSNVELDETGKYHPYKPGFAYEHGIKQIVPFAIKGIICYQGESNAQEIDRVMEYGTLSSLMVNDFRKKWNDTRMSFYYAQLSSIDSIKYKSQFWPIFRDEQRKMLQWIPHSGMAVTSDIGLKNDVHPTNKKEVGERLARWALNIDYKKKLVASGPLPIRARYKAQKVYIKYAHAGSGLFTEDRGPVTGFSFDGTTSVAAYIRKHQVILHTAGKPEYIYYAWKPYSDGNLVNGKKLPASTFKIKVQ